MSGGSVSTPRSLCQPLRSTGITPLHHYYELLRLPELLMWLLTVYRLVTTYRYLRRIQALPSSSQVIRYVSSSQSPVGIHSLTFTAASFLPSVIVKTSASTQQIVFRASICSPFGYNPHLSCLRFAWQLPASTQDSVLSCWLGFG